jgi:hypothetical protein
LALPARFLFAAAPGEAASLVALLPQDDPAFPALLAAALAGSPQLAEALARVDLARAEARGASRGPPHQSRAVRRLRPARARQFRR